MNKSLLFSFLLAAGGIFSQEENQSRIKAELVEWDAVRGEWLAESFNAMANNQPIPDRTFPEDLTPAEMYSLVPAERQGRIREIAGQQSRTGNPRETNNQTTNPSGRIPVGETANNRPINTGDRYNYYVTRPGCPLTTGRSYGDPHIRTFDGKTYSFQTVGEYVLSGSPDRQFEVQARQKPQTNQVSLNTAVAMNVYGDRVGIYASDSPDGQTGTSVRVNGRPVFMNNETFYLPHGGTIQHSGKEYVVTWPTGEKVQARMTSTSGMRFMNISVYVYECNGDYFGLMGNANGRSDDDFAGSNNRGNFASSTIFEPFGSRDFGRNTSAMEREHLAFLARDFGSQFLVNDQTSLFDYGFGQSSWTFYDPSFPRTHLTLGDLSQADRDRARRECERQGILADEMAGCVMDLAHANIQPTVRPNNPNRTEGRVLNPVSERRPNTNRPDVFERDPGSNDVRTPSGTRNGSETPTDRQPGTVVQPTGSDRPATERKPETNESTRGSSVTKPSSTRTENNSGEIRKPIEDVNSPSNSRNSTSRPAESPASKPGSSPGSRSGDQTKPSTTGRATSTPSNNSGNSRTESRSSSTGSSSRSQGSSGTSSPSSGRSGGQSGASPRSGR